MLHTYCEQLHHKRVLYSHPPPPDRGAPHLLVVGGLNDGLNSIPYVPRLEALCHAHQVLLTSSYTGFGHSSLAQDVREMAEAVAFVRHTYPHRRLLGLLGHSTGCQIVLCYAKALGSTVDFAVLQAPVSDREYLASSTPHLPQQIASAESLDREEFVPAVFSAAFGPGGVTASRFLSLARPHGADDLFSSDFTDEAMAGAWAGIELPLLLLYSRWDEYVPSHVDNERLLQRWSKHVTMGPGSGLIDANHAASGDAAGALVAARIAEFLSSLHNIV